VLYVTGRLGGSRLGKHLTFEPRVAEGRWLREGQWATAMMDVSDGLSTDLRRLLQRSGVGVELEAAAVPIDPAVDQLQDGRSPLEHAWSDGEDFELLFTVAASRRVAFEAAWRAQFELACTAIGRITDQSGECTLVEPSGARRRWTAHGYEHFRSADR
jgi:thiamine-monophosphate kinase